MKITKKQLVKLIKEQTYFHNEREIDNMVLHFGNELHSDIPLDIKDQLKKIFRNLLKEADKTNKFEQILESLQTALS